MSQEDKAMAEFTIRRGQLSAIRLPWRSGSSSSETRLTLPPRLEAEARACYQYATALNTNEREWIAAAREQWIAAWDVVDSIDKEAARSSRPGGDGQLTLPSRLKAQARACYEYAAAVSTSNRKWIGVARERWIAARGAVDRADEEAA
jgi:hypothetical protein